MASTINGTSTGNGGLISTGDDSGILNIQTNETTAITVDASQRVGIGTSSPTQPLQINMTTGDQGIKLQAHNTTAGNRLSFADSSGTEYGLVNYDHGSDFMSFYTNSSERMRIDSSGNLLVGTTSQTPGYGNTNTGVQIGGTNLVSTFSRSQTDFVIVSNQNTIDGSTYYQMQFRVSNVSKGSITSSSSATSYNTSSDYRLKNTIAPMTGALAKVALLKPRTYKWNIDGSTGQGFIAHELDEVVPECVTGAKDAVDADGNPKYQGVDTSFLVATLTAAIQELKVIVDAQAVEIAALKA